MFPSQWSSSNSLSMRHRENLRGDEKMSKEIVVTYVICNIAYFTGDNLVLKEIT